MLAWLIEFATSVYTLFHKGEPFDGMIPYRRLKGKDWSVRLPNCCETVEFRQRTRHKLDSRWQEGIFLGVRVDSTEKIVGTSGEVFVVQSVRRVLESRHYNGELLLSIKGVPWKLRPGSDTLLDELPEPTVLRPERPEHEAQPTEPAKPKAIFKNFQITQANLEKYGRTTGCEACEASRIGSRQRGLQHSPECRQRIESAIVADPVESDRYFRAIERHEAKAAKSARVAGDESCAGRGVTSADAVATGQAAGSGTQFSDHASTGGGGAASSAEPRANDSNEPMADTSLKRAPPDEGDVDMTEMHQLLDPDEEVDSLIMSLRDTYIMSVQEQVHRGSTPPVCEARDVYEGFDPHLWAAFDDVHGGHLDPSKVKEARMKEIKVINDVGVWEVMLRSEMPAGLTTITGRWVDTNKGDNANPNYRRWHVGREIKRVKHQRPWR